MELLSDIFKYLSKRKKWWLAPIIIMLLFLGILILVAESSVVGSFVYTLF